jgi:hypothetical protein
VTAVGDERTLTRVLDELSDHKYRYIGVVSTNLLDQLFLLQRIRIACPNAQFIINTPELMFSHHEAIPYLRGMLVASTYPLYPKNQAWSHSNWGSRYPLGVGNTYAPSIFNATAAHLAELYDRTRVSEYLIEYSTPFDECFQNDSIRRAPAVWISVVGQRGLYPVWVDLPSPEDLDGIYDPVKDGGEIKVDEAKENMKVIADQLPEPSGSWLVLFILFSLGIITYSTELCFCEYGKRCIVLVGPGAAVLWLLVVVGRWIHFWWAPFIVLLLSGLVLLPIKRLESLKTRAATLLPCDHGQPSTGPERRVKQTILAMSVGFYLTFGAPLWILFVLYGLSPPLWSVWPLPLDLLFLAIPTLVEGLIGLLQPLAATDRLQPLAATDRWRPYQRELEACLGQPAEGGMSELAQPVQRPAETGDDSLVSITNRIFRGGCIVLPLLILFLFCWHDSQNLLLYCERAVVLTNGVTPLMPLLFLAIIGVAWQYCEWRRVRASLHLSQTDIPVRAGDVSPALRTIRDTYDEFKKSLGGSIWSFFRKRPNAASTRDRTHVYSIVLAILTIPLLVLEWLKATPTFEYWVFQIGYRIVLLVACYILLRKLIELVTLWRIARNLMEALTGLPIIKAFDRLPLRAGVFGQATDRVLRQSERRHLITWQARLLARDFDHVRQDLLKCRFAGISDPEKKESGVYQDFRQKLDTLAEQIPQANNQTTEFPPERWRLLSASLVSVVEPFWSHRPIASAFADAPRPGSTGPERYPDWSPGQLAGCGESKESRSRLSNWLFAAEDYMALISVSQLGLIFQYLWSLIEFLVVGSLALLLSITSYPFMPQAFLLTTMGLAIAVLMVVIATIVIQVNRNELVSRIQKTTPNRISLDHRFLGDLFTYILPLLLALAALSVSLSDLFRSWFEPVFR